MSDDLTIRLPTVEGEILDQYPDKCEKIDAEGRIIHSNFCGLSEKLANGESIWGSKTMTVEINGSVTNYTIQEEWDEA